MYTDDDYETTADLNEQVWHEKLDADMQQAQYEAEGRELDRLHAQGICTHGSLLGHRNPSFYDVDDIQGMLKNARFGNRGEFDGQQSNIGEGKALCLDCGEIVPDPCP